MKTTSPGILAAPGVLRFERLGKAEIRRALTIRISSQRLNRLSSTVGKRLMRQGCSRMLPCITEGGALGQPYDNGFRSHEDRSTVCAMPWRCRLPKLFAEQGPEVKLRRGACRA